jgi:hypothetical protein
MGCVFARGCVFASSSVSRTSNASQDIAGVGCGAPTASRSRLREPPPKRESLFCAWPHSSLLAFRSSAKIDVGPQPYARLAGPRSDQGGRQIREPVDPSTAAVKSSMDELLEAADGRDRRIATATSLQRGSRRSGCGGSSSLSRDPRTILGRASYTESRPSRLGGGRFV